MENNDREIKFRVWDGENMYCDIAVGRHRHDQPTAPNSAFIIYDGCCKFIHEPFIAIMQYTGLKDKNGIEIYEKDILRMNCCNTRNFVTAIVEWSNFGFVPEIRDKTIKVKGGSHDGKRIKARKVHSWLGYHHCFSFPQNLEVIGNIYEGETL